MKKISFLDILVIIYIVLCTTPYTLRNYYLLIFIVGIMWVFLMFIFGGLKKLNNKILILIIVYIVWTLLLRAINYSSANWGNYIIRWGFWIPLLMGLYYKENPNKQRKFVFIAMLALAINIVDNVRLDTKFPGILEVITSLWYSDYWIYNFANTSFFLCVMLMIFSTMWLVVNSKNKNINILLLLFSLGSLYIISLSGRATYFIQVIVIVPFILIFMRGGMRGKAIYIFFYIVLILVLLLTFVIFEDNLDKLISMIGNERIEVRIHALLNPHENTSKQYLLRLDLMKMSIGTWLSNIITVTVGIGYHQNINPFLTGVGQHSGFIDLLGYYGIVGLAMELSIFIIYYREFKFQMPSKKKEKIFQLLFLIIMLNNFVSNIYMLDISLYLFMIMPFFILTAESAKRG